MVVRPLLWPVSMEFSCKNYVGPQPYPIEGIGAFTLMVMALWVDVLAVAPMVNVPWKPQILPMHALEL